MRTGKEERPERGDFGSQLWVKTEANCSFAPGRGIPLSKNVKKKGDSGKGENGHYKGDRAEPTTSRPRGTSLLQYQKGRNKVVLMRRGREDGSKKLKCTESEHLYHTKSGEHPPYRENASREKEKNR